MTVSVAAETRGTGLVPGTRPGTQDAAEILKSDEARPEQPFVIPNAQDIPVREAGDLIRYGIEILQHTSRIVGPNAPDPALRYSRNNLDCTNCHEAGPSGLPGTKPFALPFANVVNDYPKLDVKSMRVISIEDRVAGMLGAGAVKVTPEKREMRAVVAYLKWLNSTAAPNQRMHGAGLIRDVAWPSRAADPEHGARLYAENCAACHGPEGLGQRNPDFDQGGGYAIPPIAGDDTYDDSGHMYMVPLLTRFLAANMPFGSTAEAPQLSVEDAYDIAAFVNSALPRGRAPNRTALYPDPAFRPQGFAIPENFPGDQEGYRAARFGPYRKDE